MYYLSYLILIPGAILSFWAQRNIKSTYRRYAQVQSQMGMTGAEVAQTILQNTVSYTHLTLPTTPYV